MHDAGAWWAAAGTKTQKSPQNFAGDMGGERLMRAVEMILGSAIFVGLNQTSESPALESAVDSMFAAR